MSFSNAKHKYGMFQTKSTNANIFRVKFFIGYYTEQTGFRNVQLFQREIEANERMSKI